MQFQDEIEIYLRSRFTVIWVASYEEDRIITTLKALCERANPQRRLFTWDVAARLKAVTNTDSAALPDVPDARTALEFIAKADGERDAVFVLKDFHNCLRQMHEKEIRRFFAVFGGIRAGAGGACRRRSRAW